MRSANRSPEAAAKAAAQELPPAIREEALDVRFGAGVVSPRTLEEWRTGAGWTRDQTMRALLPLAASMASAPISGFHVGAVVAALTHDGQEGALYLGANLEFDGDSLVSSVHAEQSTINRAWLDGAPAISAIATSAPPCGPCRQFLAEIRTGPSGLRVLMPESELPLSALLPQAFLPGALGVESRLLDPTVAALELPADAQGDDLAEHALFAAARSYAPYSGCLAGVALRLAGGQVVVGRSCENVAYNPSLSPLQSALATLAAPRVGSETILHAVGVETVGRLTHRHRDQALLAHVAPGLSLRTIVVRT